MATTLPLAITIVQPRVPIAPTRQSMRVHAPTYPVYPTQIQIIPLPSNTGLHIIEPDDPPMQRPPIPQVPMRILNHIF